MALNMVMRSGAKYLALLLGVTFTAFLVTFAGAFFCGMMTRGFALVAENPAVEVWVMDPAVECPEQTVNLPSGVLDRVRSVEGVASAVPLAVARADVRFAGGRFVGVEVIGVDNATLMGVPPTEGNSAADALRSTDAAVVADGGTEGKLVVSAGGRAVSAGDEVWVNDEPVRIAGRVAALPRFPARPLMYMTYANALRVLPAERTRMTFVMVMAARGVSPAELAVRITAATGLRARASADFEADTVRWFLENSEDVGDVEAMLTVALCVGLGGTGVMFYLFTQDNLRSYAMLKAMGAGPAALVRMMLAQAVLCALLGAGIGVGLCAAAAPVAAGMNLPFRMMWFAPLAGAVTVVGVTLVAAALSLRPVMRLEPAMVFAGGR